jgi:CubicO group peptidase (beta-lactamase class C family)
MRALASRVARGADDLPTRVEQLRQTAGLPALTAAMVKHGVVTSVATGVRKLGDATWASSDDLWHLGSCTKAMTATVVASLVEEGHIHFDSELQSLPLSLATLHPDYKAVTLGMLLAHRGGTAGQLDGDLSGFGDGGLWCSLWDPLLEPRVGRRRVLEAVLSVAPSRVPGTTFDYSNAGYTIVGSIIELLTGSSWEELITARLFRPLGMNSCGFGAAGDAGLPHPDQPWGHELTDTDSLNPVPPGPHADNPLSLGPAGSVHCSLADWAKFGKLHLDGFQGKPTPILRAASFAKLHDPYPGQYYTYGGWNRVDRGWAGGPALTHSGSNTLNYAVIWVAPKLELCLLSTANAGHEKATAATDGAVGALLNCI